MSPDINIEMNRFHIVWDLLQKWLDQNVNLNYHIALLMINK